tara:strand:+ start:228 stop:434 length:207 start_codon:yes stop_codon:yes gene_type:complete
VIFKSESKELYIPRTRFSKPLNTESTITRAAVPIATPNIEIKEIKLTNLFELLMKEYLLDKKNTNLIS